MRKAIAQKHGFGCGAACVAFTVGVSYDRAVNVLGVHKAATCGFLCKELIVGLSSFGFKYKLKYIKPRTRTIYEDGAIVFIKRSSLYPYGHYLIRHNGCWMDPWINLPFNQDVEQAKSGFRKRLPGKLAYIIYPSKG